MATLFFFRKKLQTSIFDVKYFENGKLNLNSIKQVLDGLNASYDENKVFNDEGYIDTKVSEDNTTLTTTYIFKNTLGQYTTIMYDENESKVNVTRLPYSYFGQSKILIKDDLTIMVKANYSNEECVKGKCLSFLEDLGIDVEQIKFGNDIFQYIRNHYSWRKIKLQKIEREKDSTKNISYEIDPSSDKCICQPKTRSNGHRILGH